MKNFWGAAWAKKFWPSKEYLTTAKKRYAGFFWRSIILIAVASIAILIPYLIHILEQFTEEGFPPLLDICMILYVCPTLAIIIYEITKNVIVTVHLLRKGFGVAEDEVISVKHVHIRGSRPHTNYYKVLCAWRRNGRTKGISRRCTAVPFLSPGSPLRFPPVMALAFLKALWYNEKR